MIPLCFIYFKITITFIRWFYPPTFSMVKTEKFGQDSQFPGSTVNSFKTTVLTFIVPRIPNGDRN